MSGEAERTERERAAFSAWSEGSDAGDGFDAEAIWKAAAGQLSERETARWLDRAAEEGEVAEAWLLARELQREAGLEPEEAPSRPGVARHRLGAWMAAAAALILVVGLSLSKPWDRVEAPPVYRAVGEGALGSLIGDEATLPREAARLRWTPAEGEGWTYTLRVATEDLVEIARGDDLSDSEFRIPSEVLAPLPAGTRVYWRVAAENEDGRRRSSPTFFLELE